MFVSISSSSLVARQTLVPVHGPRLGPDRGCDRARKVLEVGPITATKKSKETIPLPPVLGGLALAGGVALLVFSARGPLADAAAQATRRARSAPTIPPPIA